MSSTLPWARASAPGEEIVLHPLITDAFRPSALVVLALGAVGVGLHLAHRALTAVVGFAGLLWAGWASLIWMLGMRLQWVQPDALLLDGAVVQLAPGVIVAMVGGVTAFAAAVAETASAGSADPRRLSLPVARSLGALAVVVLLLWARSFRWFLLVAGPLEWSVGAEAVPGIGDVFSLVVLATGAATIAGVLVRARWLPIAVIIGGATIAVLAVVSYVAVNVLSSAVESTLDRFGPTAGWDPEVSTGAGLLITCAAGAAALLLGVLLMRGDRSRHVQPAPTAPWQGEQLPSVATDPFSGPSPF